MGDRPVEERLFTLACVLLAGSPQGLTKQQVFQSVQDYSKSKSEQARDKQFERDKDQLRRAGVAIETFGASSNPEDLTDARYRISPRSFDWPPNVKLGEEHWKLLELAARAWNDQAMQLTARDALIRLRALGIVSDAAEPQIFSLHLSVPDGNLHPIHLAIAELRTIQFEYRKGAGESQQRTVNPWRVRPIAGQWVLLGFDKVAREPRNYLLRRIRSAVHTLPDEFEEPTDTDVALAEKSLEEFVRNNIAELEIEPGTEAWWHFGGGDSETVRVNFMDLHLLAEDLREFGGSVRVIEPEALRIEVNQGFREVLSKHG